jgi:uncharacterized protein YbjT (DUF2867 family)
MDHRATVLHGATGVQGSVIADELRRRGWHVAGLARSARPDAGVAGVDLADAEALASAYRGADAVVVQLPLAFDRRVVERQVDAVLRAVEDAAVPRAVLNTSTLLPPDEIGVPFIDGRVRLARELAGAVAAATAVMPLATFMENMALPASIERLERRDELAHPYPADRAVPWLALADLAAVVADALEAPQPPPRQVVAGPDALTGHDAAAAIGVALDRPVEWVTISHLEYEAMLAPALGTDVAAGIAAAYAAPPPPPVAPPGSVRGATTLRQWSARNLR